MPRVRKAEWEQARKSMFGGDAKPKGVAGRENVPDTACGKCVNFAGNINRADGTGYCGILKTGSDISLDEPVYTMEGKIGFICLFNTDAAQCKHYELMSMVDTDGTECADPKLSRQQRQMQKIFEK